MTNEEFIAYLNTASCRESIIDHARKLVAVDETAKKCFQRMAALGLDEEEDFDNLMVLIDTRERE